MSQQQQSKDTVNDILEQGRGLVQRGNERHIIVRRADGSQLADLTMTVAVILGVFLFFTGPWGFFIAIALTVYGLVNKVKIEVVRTLGDGDTVVELRKPKNDE